MFPVSTAKGKTKLKSSAPFSINSATSSMFPVSTAKGKTELKSLAPLFINNFTSEISPFFEAIDNKLSPLTTKFTFAPLSISNSKISIL